jgi:hypothetical protein
VGTGSKEDIRFSFSNVHSAHKVEIYRTEERKSSKQVIAMNQAGQSKDLTQVMEMR